MKVVAILMVFDTAWLQCCLLCNNSKAIQSMGTKMPIKTVLGHFHMHNTALEYKKKKISYFHIKLLVLGRKNNFSVHKLSDQNTAAS